MRDSLDTMTMTSPDPNAGISVGQPVPDLTLTDDQGADVALRELRGKRVVLYFYPKDETPGCTTQACALRDSWRRFEAVEDLVVYGVSPDGVTSHQTFRAAHDLPFHLLVDEDHRLADALGFWAEQVNDGRKYWGVERSTVIVGADGNIQSMVRKVRPAMHVDWLAVELGLA